MDENHISHELIVVDDDSPDETWEIAREMTEEISSLRVIRRVGESGLATAVVCGWTHANGKFLGVIDGDGQHPPELLLDLLAQFDEELKSRWQVGIFQVVEFRIGHRCVAFFKRCPERLASSFFRNGGSSH